MKNKRKSPLVNQLSVYSNILLQDVPGKQHVIASWKIVNNIKLVVCTCIRVIMTPSKQLNFFFRIIGMCLLSSNLKQIQNDSDGDRVRLGVRAENIPLQINARINSTHSIF